METSVMSIIKHMMNWTLLVFTPPYAATLSLGLLLSFLFNLYFSRSPNMQFLQKIVHDFPTYSTPEFPTLLPKLQNSNHLLIKKSLASLTTLLELMAKHFWALFFVWAQELWDDLINTNFFIIMSTFPFPKWDQVKSIRNLWLYGPGVWPTMGQDFITVLHDFYIYYIR